MLHEIATAPCNFQADEVLLLSSTNLKFIGKSGRTFVIK